MSRSKWKYLYLNPTIIRQNKNKKKKELNIWSRNSIIPHFLIDQTVNIHTGKDFKKIKITADKIGFKFGEFASTRKSYIYKGKKKIIGRKKK